MRKLILTAALGAACLGLAGCGEQAGNKAADDSANASEGNAAAAPQGSTASASFPRGARIVEENGVFFRVDPDGTRVRLEPTDSRIVVEDNVRYRVDPDGSRVRIDPQGAVIDIDLPDVDVGINEKGNPDVDVGDRDPDGGR